MILRDYAITTQFEIFDTFTLWVTNIRSHMPLTQKNTMILRDYAITTQFPLIHQKQRPARSNYQPKLSSRRSTNIVDVGMKRIKHQLYYISAF